MPMHRPAPEEVSIAQLQAALQASEQISSAIVETAVNSIITIDARCIIETVNTSTERLFGYQRTELIGRNISMLMPQPYRDRHDGYVQNYLDSGVKRIIGIGREVVGQRKDGSVFPIDLSVGEAVLPTGRRIFTGIIRDLTSRKALEDKILHISEEEQLRIGQDIHDDLCQQLAAIGCLAKVAQNKLTKAGSAEAQNLAEIVQLISKAGTRARETSRGLMPVVIDSGGLMAALGELAAGTARAFEVACEFRYDNPVQVSDNKLSVQLFRIAQEAVSNAVKHGQANRVDVHLARQSGNIVLTVRDNGIGIPDSPAKGTGMGLLTMSHRAQMMGGTLKIEPRQGGGTQVTCSVPAPAKNP
ncbi:PAS domain S-box protein [Prosthecobacter sp.]|uniref:sensor histidine kinase n=1 Tax=Prosthecobacter sp. TaxID=1965333 RepID=UPI002488B975|nr:PAS domain S-box protein [Prosthecobacter sp.]MDI1311068.1 PAS domain S-box protein [Prosthecobacter sp.]